MSRPKGSKNKPKVVGVVLPNAPDEQLIVAPNSLYNVVLSVNGKDYEAKGETLLETIESLKANEIYKTKGKLKISKNGKTVERILYIPQMKKLFSDVNSLTKRIFMQSTVKYIENLLK